MELGANVGTQILIPVLTASALLRGADPKAHSVSRKLDFIDSHALTAGLPPNHPCPGVFEISWTVVARDPERQLVTKIRSG